MYESSVVNHFRSLTINGTLKGMIVDLSGSTGHVDTFRVCGERFSFEVSKVKIAKFSEIRYTFG